MTFLNTMLLLLLGLCSGFAVSGGAFAAIMGIGVLPRFAYKTHTAHRIAFYEDCAAVGAILGNVLFLYALPVPVGNIGGMVYGMFSGIFVGCTAVALAEILDVYPNLLRKMNLKTGLAWMILGLSFGKCLGAWVQLYQRW